jgi:hypothetical protein
MKNVKSTRTVARTTKSAPAVAVVVAATSRSAYIALCAEHGLINADARSPGLPMREMFRDRIEKCGASRTWGGHSRVTDLHAHCIATAIMRRGDAMSAASRKWAAAVFARTAETFDPTQWRVDASNAVAEFVGARRAAKSAPRKSRRAA